jgi:hypothetical protein
VGFVALYYQSAIKTITAPSGWIEIASGEQSSTPRFTLHVYYKVLGGSEPSTYTFSWTGSVWTETQGISVHNADPTTPIDQSAKTHTSGNASSIDCPAVTPTVNNDLLITFVGNWNWTAFTAGSSQTLRSTSGSNAQAEATKTGPASGVSSGVLTMNQADNQEMVGFSVAVMEVQSAAQDTPELRGRPEGLRGQNQMQQLLAT